LRSHFAFLDLLRPYAERLMRGSSPLSTAERELLAAYVSGLNQCHYCHGSHALVAQRFGMDATLLETLMVDIDAAPVKDSLKPLLHYVRKLTNLPARLSAADAAAVYAAGWNDEALMHAIAICAYFSNMNRLVEGAGIGGSDDTIRAGAERLIASGYK
jgi:uncharacterized peroxidase-related enzyme